MQIECNQQGPNMQINITFDDPEQSNLFHKKFETLLQELATELDGMMMTVDSENAEVNKQLAKRAIEEAINMFVPKEDDGS
jgi:hypothetical protein